MKSYIKTLFDFLEIIFNTILVIIVGVALLITIINIVPYGWIFYLFYLVILLLLLILFIGDYDFYKSRINLIFIILISLISLNMKISYESDRATSELTAIKKSLSSIEEATCQSQEIRLEKGEVDEEVKYFIKKEYIILHGYISNVIKIFNESFSTERIGLHGGSVNKDLVKYREEMVETYTQILFYTHYYNKYSKDSISRLKDCSVSNYAFFKSKVEKALPKIGDLFYEFKYFKTFFGRGGTRADLVSFRDRVKLEWGLI